MRQVGLALHMYDLDFNGKLPNPGANQSFNFENQNSPANPPQVFRPYVGIKNPSTPPPPIYICQSALLAPVVSDRKLTEPQKQAIGLALQQINQALAANPALDTKEMYELRLRMFKAVDGGKH